MRLGRAAVAAALVLLLAPGGGAAARGNEPEAPTPREGATHAAPLHGSLVRIYDAPDNPFAPGHRGVDVAAPEGSPVRASADGVVSFAGVVVGNRAVTVDHGNELVTTYSYLQEIGVAVGQPVARGDVVGTVGHGHPGSDLEPHVHLSARRSGVYFDPLELYVGASHSDLLDLVG